MRVFSRIQKWGNSQGVRIPKAILKKASLKENDRVEILVEDGNLVIRPVRKRISLAERIAEYQGGYEPTEWETGSPVGKEVL
jgi:antitoxin MazE